MTYYELKNTAEPTITGAYPQLNLVDYKNLQKMLDLDHKAFISSKEEFPEFKFTKKTIVTDLLTCSNIKLNGFPVSEKFKNLIENLVKEGIKTTPFQFIPLNIKKSEGNFYFFQSIPDPSIIDYDKTIFKDLANNDRITKIKNHESYSPRLRVVTLVLKNDYDLFNNVYGLSTILINEKLKELIEKNNITGTSEIQEMIYHEIL